MLGNPGGPIQADLNATIDAQLTDAIRAKAEELDSDPVKIYQWVRNNIRFIPSHGSIQGADYTLAYGQGNSFDTSSLLIALLRAANIPARYAIGTVRIPADKAMNWVGNAKTPEAAGNLLGQGGIPNLALTSGGVIKQFEVEHIWVEAWIDYLPSRGAKHTKGDSWIPMDASFKQYEFTEGLDLETAVPFDAQALVDNIQQQAIINEDEGWVQNVPQQAVETAINDYQTQLEDFINSQHPDATVGDVLGTSDIKTVIRESLSASLPYELRTRKLVSSELSDHQRWKFKYQLNYPVYGQAGETLLQISEPTVSLIGKKLALSFKPDTEADEETLASYLPEPDVDGNIDPATIPESLPGYLIHLRAEFNVGDEVTTAINPAAMGTQLLSEMGYWQPGRGWKTSKNNPIAGEYRAIALDLQGISQQQAQALQNDLEATKAKIEAEDFSNLTKQDLVGDLLYSTIFSYFALNNVQDDIAAEQANIINYRAPSYGIFKTNLQPSYWFGTPRDVKTTGLAMDVDHMSSYRVAEDNDPEAKVNFNKLTGKRYSEMEHIIPVNMFSSQGQRAQGISAVKALAMASAEGQQIFTITNENLETALASIILAEDTETEIRNSVNAGYVVTAHEKQINFNGWLGEGYIITDPVTGDAAYKISGGGNGGFILLVGMLMIAILAVIVVSSMVAGPFTFFLGAVGLVLLYKQANDFTKKWSDTVSSNCSDDEKTKILNGDLFLLFGELLGVLIFRNMKGGKTENEKELLDVFQLLIIDIQSFIWGEMSETIDKNRVEQC